MSAIIDLQPWHLLHVVMRLPTRDIEEARLLGYKDVQQLAVRRAWGAGVKFTILASNGTPMVCFGVEDTGIPGVGELWMLRAIGAEPYAKTGAKAMKAIIASNEYRRLSAAAKSDCEPCKVFLRWLGFTYEGTKRAFFADGSSLDEFSYVRTT
jgi:hypothetical protein